MTKIDTLLESARIAAGHLAPVVLMPVEAAVLLAEVERLRALEADAERALVKAELWNYYAAFVAANGAASITELVVQRDEARAAVEAERAAVVAWLRARGVEIESWPPGGMNDISVTYNIIAHDIERGEHRNEGGE